MKKLRNCLIITISVLYFTSVKAQTKRSLSESPFLDRTDFKIGYFGDIFWNNGLNLGAEYLWKEKVKVKQKRRKQKTNTHQFLFNGNIGYTTNFSTKVHNGLYTHYGITWRRLNKKNKLFSVSLNPVGYYRAFYPETYEVKGDNVSKVKLPGRGYYAPSIVLGIGKFRENKKRSGWYLNLRYSVRTPYNASKLNVLALEYGHSFNFKKKRR